MITRKIDYMIVKELKHITYSYSEKDRELLITRKPLDIQKYSQMTITRNELMSLARFALRIALKRKI
jgi:isocitrate/isopropylmalate dehydrogenase